MLLIYIYYFTLYSAVPTVFDTLHYNWIIRHNKSGTCLQYIIVYISIEILVTPLYQ